MLKITALLFNTFALLIYQLFFTDVVTITQNAPTTAKAETEFVVEVTVKKGDIKGFAKLQLDLPVGFTAVEDINNGASFTFVNQSVKFIWMALPAEKEFKISYKVLVAAGTVGDKIITGKLSYVVDNVKGTTILEPPSTITVGDGSKQPVVADNKPVTPPTPDPPVVSAPPVAEPTTPITTPIATPASTPATIKDANGEEIVVNCFRTTAESTGESTGQVMEGTFSFINPATQNTSKFIPQPTYIKTSATEFPVEVTIKKGKLDGFAKYIETLPVGFSATVIDGKGAAFSFVDQKAKFVWGTLPTEDEFKISYKVTVAANIGQPLASTPTTPTTPTVPKADPKPKADPIAKSDPIIPKTMQGNVIPPQGKVSYKVQILALRKEKSIDVVASLLTVTEPIELEMHQGLRKYVVGYHTVYKEARNHREQIPKAVIVPWVVAYDNGKRTTVQNALMITSQQWFR